MTKVCKKHQFSLFGKLRETCVSCGKENEEIKEWRQQLIRDLDNNISVHALHPYLSDGRWTTTDLKRFMKR